MAENRSRWDFSKEGTNDAADLRYNIGVPGPRGAGISRIEINEDGTATIHYTDNQSYTLSRDEMDILVAVPIQRWLNAHPEAALTVQVPAITSGEIEDIVNSITGIE